MADQKSEKEDKSKPEFNVFVNNVKFTTQEHELTGSQIKALAGIPSDYELFQVKGDQTVPVGNEETVHIHNNLHFRAIPAGTFGQYDTTA